MITICTPTWNRESTLPRLFKSLMDQDCHDFEWVVVDDGSEDHTENVVNQMAEIALFRVHYFRKENGGRHTAINIGLQKAKGEIFFLLDSDDWLPRDAISKVLECFDSIKGRTDFAGIVGLKCFEDGSMVGRTFEGTYRDFDFFDRKNQGVIGDRAEVFYTDVLKRFPFPVFPNERFVSERMNWYRIANAGYKMRWFNTNLYYCEYQPDGLSAQRGRMRKNMGALGLETKELIHYKKVSIIEKCMFVGRYSLLKSREGERYERIGRDLEIPGIIAAVCSMMAKVYETAVYSKGKHGILWKIK